MSCEYHRAVTIEKIDAAVRLTVMWWLSTRCTPLAVLAERAVDWMFCPCVTSAANTIEGHRSSIHAALIANVLQRAGAVSADILHQCEPPRSTNPMIVSLARSACGHMVSCDR